MTIDEAIIKHIQKADSYHKAMPNYGEAAEHKQLAEWLKELKEAKRLLKAAINDIYKECSCNTCGCDICQYNREICDYDDRFTWRHKAAVFKLIGDDIE